MLLRNLEGVVDLHARQHATRRSLISLSSYIVGSFLLNLFLFQMSPPLLHRCGHECRAGELTPAPVTVISTPSSQQPQQGLLPDTSHETSPNTHTCPARLPRDFFTLYPSPPSYATPPTHLCCQQRPATLSPFPLAYTPPPSPPSLYTSALPVPHPPVLPVAASLVPLRG